MGRINNPKWFGAFPAAHRIVVFAAILLTLCGCVTLKDPEASQEYRADMIARLPGGSQAGQTVVSRRPGMNGIQLWLQSASEPQNSTNGSLQVSVFRFPGEDRALFSTTVSSDRLQAEFPLTISFPPIYDAPNQSYYFTLQPENFDLDILGRNEEAYAYGDFYLAGNRETSDLTFRLMYDYGIAAMGEDLRTILANIWIVFPLVVVLWLPGRVLIAALDRPQVPESHNNENFDWGERVALSIGLSLAVIATSILWTTLLGITWTPLLSWIAGFTLLLALIWLERNQLKSLRSHTGELIASWIRKVPWTAWALAAIFLLSLAVRLAMVRDLAASAWVDSIHHTLIIRKIIETGALPPTYEPYLESQFATYHSGFHAAAAFFFWLSGMPLTDGVLVFSQVLNSLCVFSVYLFTTTLTKDRRAAVFAALIAGLFTPMPAYYASWGRFTQLAGLLILPVCLTLTIRLMKWLEREPGISPVMFLRSTGLPQLLILGLSLAGLALTHYRVLAFLALLLAAYLSLEWGAAVRNKRAGTTVIMQLAVMSAAVGLAVVFSLPWWPRVIQTALLPKAVSAASNIGIRSKPFQDFYWGFLNTALGKEALILAGLGWGLALFHKKRFSALFPLWLVLMFLLANSGAIGIPGLGFVNNTSVEIILFMPIAALGGYFLSQAASFIDGRLTRKWRGLFRGALTGATLVSAIWGARLLMQIINQGTILIRQADIAALAWIESNIPSQETLLINSFLWGYGVYAGNDGGFWIAPLAGRQTLPPPVIHSLSNPVSVHRPVRNLTQQLYEVSDKPASLFSFMKENNFRYIYTGVRGGPISPKALIDSGLFTPLYHESGTWVLVIQ